MHTMHFDHFHFFSSQLLSSQLKTHSLTTSSCPLQVIITHQVHFVLPMRSWMWDHHWSMSEPIRNHTHKENCHSLP